MSIFKARPSPFYVMDEVEAALDDTNVGRLLDIFEELRASSQLIIITHQKRTMEIADSLYGVSMRADGVSAVISQRLREPQPRRLTRLARLVVTFCQTGAVMEKLFIILGIVIVALAVGGARCSRRAWRAARR